MVCKLILKDNSTFDFRVNGTNLITKNRVPDVKLSPENLSEIQVIVDDNPAVSYSNILLVQQIFYENEYWLAFRQKSEEEIQNEKLQAQNNFLEDCIAEMAMIVYA